MGKLKELLDGQDWGYFYRMSDYSGTRERELEEEQEGKIAVTELEHEVKSMFLQLVGPNERVEYHGMPDVIIRNNLRDELREKVKEL